MAYLKFLVVAFLLPSMAFTQELQVKKLVCKDFTLKVSDYCKKLIWKPKCPEVMGTKYRLHTRTGSRPIDPDNIVGDFSGKERTIFIVHGYNTDINKPWVQLMKGELLNVGDANVILVDWSKEAIRYDYLRVVRNVQTVGIGLAIFMDALAKKNVQYKDMYCIGHSLGAHVCGHAGRKVKEKIGRITGLDPAGYSFRDKSTAKCSLKRDNARSVDVIHTNGADDNPSFYMGKLVPMGTIDFYPNGGREQLPNCEIPYDEDPVQPHYNKSFSAFIEIKHQCWHSMAHVYFIQSIRDRCKFWTRQACDDYRNLPNSCKHIAKDAVMGYYADSVGVLPRDVFYVDIVNPPIGCPTTTTSTTITPTTTEGSNARLSSTPCILWLLLLLLLTICNRPCYW